jgi:hypothetical protein
MAARTVILWRGSKRIASVKSKSNGTFAFAHPGTMSGHSFRASVLLMQTKTSICAAASSTFIHGSAARAATVSIAWALGEGDDVPGLLRAAKSTPIVEFLSR